MEQHEPAAFRVTAVLVLLRLVLGQRVLCGSEVGGRGPRASAPIRAETFSVQENWGVQSRVHLLSTIRPACERVCVNDPRCVWGGGGGRPSQRSGAAQVG